MEKIIENLFWKPLNAFLRFVLFLIDTPAVGVSFIAFSIFVYRNFVPTIGSDYSSGVKEGYLQSYSVKGIIWKTGEGVVVLKSFNLNKGTEKFLFSSKQQKDFTPLVGKQIKIYYKQAFHHPAWYGNSNYQVDSLTTND